MRIIKVLAMPLLITGCSSNDGPTINELVGKWKNDDGTLLELKDDGSFKAKGLTKEITTSFSLGSIGTIFSGAGNWSIQKGKGFWEIKLEFTEIDAAKNNGFYIVLVSGSNTFENKPPWYLFLWKDEEGGDRYKFEK